MFLFKISGFGFDLIASWPRRSNSFSTCSFSVSALAWLVVISPALKIYQLLFSNVLSYLLLFNSLPFPWSIVRPLALLSRTRESCNFPDSQYLASSFKSVFICINGLFQLFLDWCEKCAGCMVRFSFETREQFPFRRLMGQTWNKWWNKTSFARITVMSEACVEALIVLEGIICNSSCDLTVWLEPIGPMKLKWMVFTHEAENNLGQIIYIYDTDYTYIWRM